MASCGFQIFPRANVAQLGHCSSNELTGLKMMIICPLKSSGIALVAPCLSIGHGTLPEAKQIGRQTDVTELNAGAFEAPFKMWDVALCFIAVLRCAYAKSPPEEKIWTEL